jgi:cytidine deaminase
MSPEPDPKEQLVEAARRAAAAAWAPYSGYRVGAAVLTAFDEVVSGCNVENASYGLSMCAERVAAFTARARGLVEPGSAPLKAIAIHAPSGAVPRPCGACRQVLAELAGDDLPVIVDGPDGREETTLGRLLPQAFRLEKP